MKKLLIGLFGLFTQATFAQQDQLEVSEGTMREIGIWTGMELRGDSIRFNSL